MIGVPGVPVAVSTGVTQLPAGVALAATWDPSLAEQYGQVKLTVAQFFRVDGDTTQHAGVTPEIQFPVTVDASEFGESTFDNALPATKIAIAPHASLGNFAPILTHFTPILTHLA